MNDVHLQKILSDLLRYSQCNSIKPLPLIIILGGIWMLYFDITSIFFPKKREEENKVLKKAKEKGVESITDEEKKIYQKVIGRIILA